ncbi:hypothetical protein BVC93_01065 [Mycobacterium sp. MS1601]|uniref:HNH endonuclease signature motif containing protein n=1 Tax=Mycobacterium sp. MS1601 TaxID=1936029 RepID=UPI00097985C6|nr:HNH endonuclease signature motif containing protein [Mycobacterium sp. MS1601]AQA01244.1 hypothetical protein BVC93_01065 [Mycobacterium sp. MS1601]
MVRSAVQDREAMLADLALIEAATARMKHYSIDGFSDLELLEVQERREIVARQQPVLDHTIYQRLMAECTPKQLGAKTFTKVLVTRLRISDAEAHRRLKNAGLLGPRASLTGEPLAPQWPTVAQGQTDGLISTDHITKIRSFFHKLPKSIDHQTRENAEVELAKHARELTVDGFAKAADHMAYLLNQDGEFSDEDRQAQSYLHCGKQDADGLIPVKGKLTPEAWALIEPIFERNAAPGMCNPHDDNPCVFGTPSEDQKRADTRNQGQRNHDALMWMCRQILSTTPIGTINGLPANLIIVANLTDLEKGIGHGITAGGTRLPMSDVLKLAAHSRPWLALFDGKGLPLHLGRARRTASVAQRLMLLAQHRGCTMPGCDASAYRSQVHHANKDWQHGGETNIEDLTLACGPDNRTVETTGWTTRNRPEDGRTEWIPPPELDCGQPRTNNLHFPERIIDPDDHP